MILSCLSQLTFFSVTLPIPQVYPSKEFPWQQKYEPVFSHKDARWYWFTLAFRVLIPLDGIQRVVLKSFCVHLHRWTVPASIQCRIYLSELFVLSIIIAQALFPPAYVLPAAVIVHRLTNKAKNGPHFHCRAGNQQTCFLIFAFELLHDDYFRCLLY